MTKLLIPGTYKFCNIFLNFYNNIDLINKKSMKGLINKGEADLFDDYFDPQYDNDNVPIVKPLGGNLNHVENLVYDPFM